MGRSAVAGDGDVFGASGVMTGGLERGLRDGAGDLMGVHPTIGCRLGEMARLAVGSGGVGTAFFTAREALIDAIAVRLVGDNENAVVGKGR